MAQPYQTLFVVADAEDLGADIAIADAPTITVGAQGGILVDVVVAQADSTTAVTDAPEGEWALYTSDYDVTALYRREGQFHTQLIEELKGIAPQGDNAVVRATAQILGLKKKYARLVYIRTGGGATNTVLQMSVRPFGVRVA